MKSLTLPLIALALFANIALTVFQYTQSSELRDKVLTLRTADVTAYTNALAKIEPTLRKYDGEMASASKQQAFFLQQLATRLDSEMTSAKETLELQNNEIKKALGSQSSRLQQLEFAVQELTKLVKN